MLFRSAIMVIVPALTMIATGNAVLYTGATPVVVDVEPDTGNLDPAAVEAALSPRTRAVIPVHLYGLPCSMTALRAVCEPRGIALVEDAAEAIGTTALGRAAGTLGRAGCFSFFANKVLTTGEGGMLVTDDPALAARGRSFKDQWFVPERRFFHPHVGYNYRMSNLQAALGVAQLERVACLAAARRTVAAVYRKLLAGLPALELPLDQWQDGTNSHWMYAVRVQADAGATADALARHLAQDGIESRGFFHPLSRQPAFAAFGRPCPVAEEIAPRGLLLPTGPTLAVADQERIADSLRRFFQSPRPRV